MKVEEIKIGCFYFCNTHVKGIFCVTGFHPGDELSGYVLDNNNSVKRVGHGEFTAVFPQNLERELSKKDREKIFEERTQSFSNLLKNFLKLWIAKDSSKKEHQYVCSFLIANSSKMPIPALITLIHTFATPWYIDLFRNRSYRLSA